MNSTLKLVYEFSQESIIKITDEDDYTRNKSSSFKDFDPLYNNFNAASIWCTNFWFYY